LVVKQNLKLCSWRNNPRDVLIDTETDLSVKINKHTTISLLGHFRFKVLKGAVNINGANISALSCEGRKDQEYTAYVPATHPIAKIRGLDSTNHVHFTHCTYARPLASSSILFVDIWNAPVESKRHRSFSVVSVLDASLFLGLLHVLTHQSLTRL
jgi:polynucleotide 5'-hydroxyl-kinase GRC3/NOL9